MRLDIALAIEPIAERGRVLSEYGVLSIRNSLPDWIETEYGNA
jgi:hypothetical protein